MNSSFLARGLRKIRRRQDRRQKQALRGKYKEFYETLPVEPDTVILEARNGRAIDGNVYYILRQLLSSEEYGNLRIWVVSEDDRAEQQIRSKTCRLPGAQRIRFVRLHSEDYYRIMASAGILVNDASIPNFFIKKEGQIYLNVWHGTPLKTMGRRVSHEPHATGNVQKNFIIADYLLYPSEYMMQHMIEDYMIGNLSRAQILLGGYPRNSAFFDEESRGELRRRFAAAEERVYAYMPTWRPSLMGESLQAVLEQIEQRLEESEVLYVNVHPLAEESVDLSVFERIRPFPKELETYEFLNIADALLTDYSSVFYDFAVTGRKIVLLTYDEEEYFSTRGLYEPISCLPFPQAKDVSTAIDLLRSPKDYDDRDFLHKYCRFESARAAEHLCREVFTGEHGMEHRSMPDNGRENVLIYGGNLSKEEGGKRTIAFLKQLDPSEANYYLTFHRGDLKETYEILFELPEGIDYIGRAGSLWMTEEQQEAQEAYDKGRISFDDYWKILRPAFALERKRCFGDMRIDRILPIPEGKDSGPEASKASREEQLLFSSF
ncbi:MAG: CDP-glycerol glycerophosphotransferase family protein [Firmicutes bacterium]|nr:CDP-glycerol glycerophosphotransferase family protein [Bacillota bacterium]